MTAPKPRNPNGAAEVEKPALAFAEQITGRVSRLVPYPDAVTLAAVQQHAVWAHVYAGLDLDSATVFRRDVIAVGVERLPLRSEASLGRRRAVLTRVGEALGVLEPRDVPYAGSTASTPYSDAQVEELRSWAEQQHPDAARNAGCLLALGLGAGLLARDLCEVRASDVVAKPGGLRVRVAGRGILVDPAWSGVLAAISLTAADRDDRLFLPRIRVYKNKIGDFTRSTIGTHPRPVPQRLRATWIVQRMSEGLPVQDLLHQTGVQSLDALARFEHHLPPSRYQARP